MLIDAAYMAINSGHGIVFVATAKESPESDATVGDFRRLAELCQCPFFQGSRFTDDQINILSNVSPDLGLTMNWPTMIPENIVNKFQFGVVNAHGSDLPRYRGNACPNWAIINGDKKIGLTFHLIDPDGLDTGAVVHKEFLDIDDEVYIGDVYSWLANVVPEGFVKSIQMLAMGHLPTPQEGEVIRAYPRKPEDGRIDWKEDSHKIHRLIRASSRPFPGAFCFFRPKNEENAKKVIVWRAVESELHHDILAVPGQILFYSSQSKPVVACGEGAIELIDYVVENGGRLTGSLRDRFI